MKKLCLILLITLCLSLAAENKAFFIDFNWEKVKHYNDFQQDFFYLCQILEDSHPALYEIIPEEDFIDLKNRFAGSLELVVDKQQFAVMLQRFVSQLNDGHTQIYYAKGFGDLRVPVVLSWSGEELYISNVNQGLDINLIGSKVMKLGNVMADSLETRLGSFVSAENRYWKRYQLTNLMNLAGFLLLSGVISHEDSLDLEIQRASKIETLHLMNSPNMSWLTPHPHPVTAYSGKLFSYKLIEDLSTCYFQFNEFLDLQTARMYQFNGIVSDADYDSYHQQIKQAGGDFRIFLEKMFTDIYQNNIRNLVVDLRNNGGGNSILANQFFDHVKLEQPIIPFTTAVKLSQLMQHYYPDTVNYYLNVLKNNFGIEATLPYYYDLDLEMKESYFSIIRNKESGFYIPESNNKFDGKLIFITGNGTFSSAGDMVTIAYDNGLGMIVGEPMGQKPTSFGDILYFTLPNTGIEGSVSHKVFKRPKRSRSDEKTIYPDIFVKTDFRDKYIGGIDAAWDTITKIVNPE
jgi:hypothetical protein